MTAFLRPFAAVAALILTLIAPLAAAAGNGPADAAKIEFLPGWRATDGTHMAAIRVRLQDGWKTYWRSPGEAGLPPRFDWSGSANLARVDYFWPVPEVFDLNGFVTVGYKHELLLPLAFTPQNAGETIDLSAQLVLGVCNDICMPLDVRFSVRLGPEETKPVRAIERALDQRPDTAAEAGVSAVSCDIEPISDGLRLTARLDMPAIGAGEHAVIEAADPTVWVSEAQITRNGNGFSATADLVPPRGAAFMLDRSGLRVTVIADGRAVEISGCGS